jgi:uncharacterized protein DUF4430
VLALLVVLLGGCGFGAGKERGGGGAEMRVTRDFGRAPLGSARVAKVRESDTVMRLLRSHFDVRTRYGGRFVQSIDGRAGGGAGGHVDWFYWVNGVEAGGGAAEYELHPGDRVQWDHRDWSAGMRVPAIVGAYPEPFEHGFEGGKRHPVRVECSDEESKACGTVKGRLESAGVPVSSSTIGMGYSTKVIRVVVAPWSQARRVRAASILTGPPKESGVFARFAGDGGSLELLDRKGGPARRVEPGDGTGIVAATRPSGEDLVWLVTGLDERGVDSAAAALDGGKLRDAFAVAATGGDVEKLPLVGR